MNIFDIFIAYVSWGNNGKRRPVLIIRQGVNNARVFNITTRYESKSEVIRSKYFKIVDWKQAGLDRQSYVDTNDTITLPISSVDVKHPVGKLTQSDKNNLIEFIIK